MLYLNRLVAMSASLIISVSVSLPANPILEEKDLFEIQADIGNISQLDPILINRAEPPFLFSEIDLLSHHNNKCCDSVVERSINMSLTCSFISSPLPVGYNVDVTPFAISPSGKKYKGIPTNIPIVGNTPFVRPLNSVNVPHLQKGTYTVGYDVRLGAGSPLTVGPAGAILNDIVITNHVYGLRQETVNSGFTALFFSDLATPEDSLTVTANCILSHPNPCSSHGDHCFKHSPDDVTISLNMLYGISGGTVPVSSNYIVSPFAIAPNGKIFRGGPQTIVFANSELTGLPLNPVVIPKALYGNYFVGYEISLAIGSAPASPDTVYNFFGNIRSNPVGTQRESITLPSQLLPLGPLLTPSQVVRVTGGFVVAKP